MRTEKISEAMSKIDEKYVEKCIIYRAKKQKPKWFKFASAAACFFLIVTATVATAYQIQNRTDSDIPPENDGKPNNNGIYSIEDMNRPYKDISVSAGETGYIWRWEERTICEQYVTFEMNGIKFRGAQREITASDIEKRLGRETLVGYADHPNDDPNGTRYEAFDVYEIKNISSSRMVAVLMYGKYYVFISEKYDPPATWGGVLEEYGLSDSFEFSRFTIESKGKDDEYRLLNDDAYIWEILSMCKDAPVADALGWHETNKDYLSFGITSERLGVYKRAFYVTEHGYIWTNIFYGEYLYYIGDDAAQKIISYATKNSAETNLEPYRNSVAGTVVEITDKYVLVNDSVLCNDPKDGISFKIMLSDVRISRYVSSGIIKMNSTVMVEYEGKIDTENGYVINEAVYAAEAIIRSDGNVMIPE